MGAAQGKAKSEKHKEICFPQFDCEFAFSEWNLSSLIFTTNLPLMMQNLFLELSENGVEGRNPGIYQ